MQIARKKSQGMIKKTNRNERKSETKKKEERESDRNRSLLDCIFRISFYYKNIIKLLNEKSSISLVLIK